MRYPPEHKEETRGKIIAAAAAAFRTREEPLVKGRCAAL
jgi:hypothetical protein